MLGVTGTCLAISIHASTWEATLPAGTGSCRKHISIHASTWEATSTCMLEWERKVFQFTPLHERQRLQLRRLLKADYFNSRLYMRGNCVHSPKPQPYRHFNSRLYMRGNELSFNVSKKERISIHASTWEATNTMRKLFCACLFQFTPLHERQPGQRVRAAGREYFNSRLYMRGNVEFGQDEEYVIDFNSRLYMRGNRWKRNNGRDPVHISIHASTWEATDNIQPPSFLTANFNSRLYMRGNMQLPRMQEDHFLFQFTPLHERQRDTNLAKSGCGPFQFTPLHERQQRELS